MAKHRKFNADRFLDKFQDQEAILRSFVASYGDKLDVDAAALTVDDFKTYLVKGTGAAWDDMVEALHRAFDLSTDRGHEDLSAACDASGYEPDPEGQLPGECYSLKVLTERDDVFQMAYARNTLWFAERFTLFRGKEPRDVPDVSDASVRFQEQLSAIFKGHKKSERVLVRPYREGGRVNFVVYHERRSKAELVFKGMAAVRPSVLRPAQQDFVSYEHATGQLELETRFENEEDAIRRAFAACCLGDVDFFEGAGARDRLDFGRIAESDFVMPVPGGHSAALTDIRFRVPQKHGPTIAITSKNVLETLKLSGLETIFRASDISRAAFKITFPDDARGKRVEISGTNSVRFKRATHADDVFDLLRKWEVLLA